HLKNHEGVFDALHLVMKRRVATSKRPFHHRPRDDRKTGHERMLANIEARNLVIGEGDDVASHREHTHFEALLILGQGHVAAALSRPLIVGTALCNQTFGFRMQGELNPQCFGGRLPRAIVRRGTDTATTEDDVRRGEAALQYLHNVLLCVGHHLHTVQLQSALCKQLDQLSHMLVLPAARQQFITNEYEADPWWRDGHGSVPARRCWRKASRPKCANTSE